MFNNYSTQLNTMNKLFTVKIVILTYLISFIAVDNENLSSYNPIITYMYVCKRCVIEHSIKFV